MKLKLWKDGFYLMIYLVHDLYGYMVEEYAEQEKTCCCHFIGYVSQLVARDFLYTPSHRQDNTYQSLCCTSRGVLA